MYANSEGSGETARMRRLARAFASCLCDKYQNLMSWLKYFQYFFSQYFELMFSVFLNSINTLVKYDHSFSEKKIRCVFDDN